MRKHIENAINHVKTKSPRTRDQVAVGVAFVIVALLFGLWVVLFSYRIRAVDNTGMSALGRSLSNLGSSISEAFGKIQSGDIYNANGATSIQQTDQSVVPVSPGQSDIQSTPVQNETVKPLTENQ